jgi:hypothetical protein
MKPIWKISGKFYGWLNENGAFYLANGNRFGTISNNVLYNHKGTYWGEVVNSDYIGSNMDHSDWLEPTCYLNSRINLISQMDRIGIVIYGYDDPS